MLADPRRFSQLAASFLASGSLGILRSLFSPFSRESDTLSIKEPLGLLNEGHPLFQFLELVLPVKLQSAILLIRLDYRLQTEFYFFFLLPLILSQCCQ